MNARARVLIAGMLVTAAVASGCRNPFDPEADVRILNFSASSGGNTVQLLYSECMNLATGSNQWKMGVTATVVNFGTPGVLLTSYTAVYRTMAKLPPPLSLEPDTPIPDLGGAAGKRYRILRHVQGVTSANSSNYYSTALTINLNVISEEFARFIYTHSDIVNGGADIIVTLQGEDHNGHDVTCSGVLHVEIMQ
jgi:hypothetical protein